jgi:excisionase family DNA binding protein
MSDIDANTIALSPAGAADALSVSRRTVYALLNTGKLKARKAGNRTLIPVADLEHYLASLPSYEPSVDA